MTTPTFKPGDRVRVASLEPQYNQDLLGATGEIVSVRRNASAADILVLLVGFPGGRYFVPSELEILP